MVEDQSGEKLLNAVMCKYKEEFSAIPIKYDIKPYKGIGNFRKGKDIANVKTEQLLNDLPKRIRAFNAAFRDREHISLFIVLDNDRRETEEFRKQLNESVKDKKITLDHIFCIAIEEIEAWLLGDIFAIQKAYPNLKDRIAQKHSQYIQDEIRDGGTWEFLFDLLNPPEKGRAKREMPIYPDLGRHKCEWAEKIGANLNIRENVSPSFKFLISELDKRRLCLQP